jgi:hypothetical protein
MGGLRSLLEGDKPTAENFWKGTAIGLAGAALGEIGGGGYLVTEILTGAAEGALTGLLWAVAFDEDIGRSVGMGALMGGIMGAAKPLGEMVTNYQERGDFYTNAWETEKLVKLANSGKIDQLEAIVYIKDKYHLNKGYHEYVNEIKERAVAKDGSVS